MAKTIYLIRHGQSAANAGLKTASPEGIPLTELGWQQARELLGRLTARPELIVCSPYLRARETARPLMEKFPEVRAEIWAEAREFTYLAPASCCNTTREERRGRVEAYWQAMDPSYVDGEGAESFAGLTQRTRALYERLLASPAQTIFVFTHEQLIKSLLLQKEPALTLTERMRAFKKMTPVENTGVIKFTCEGEV